MQKRTLFDTIKAHLFGAIIGAIISVFCNYIGFKLVLVEHEVKIQNCQANESALVQTTRDIRTELNQVRTDLTSHLNSSIPKGGK